MVRVMRQKKEEVIMRIFDVVNEVTKNLLEGKFDVLPSIAKGVTITKKEIKDLTLQDFENPVKLTAEQIGQLNPELLASVGSLMASQKLIISEKMDVEKKSSAYNSIGKTSQAELEMLGTANSKRRPDFNVCALACVEACEGKGHEFNSATDKKNVRDMWSKAETLLGRVMLLHEPDLFYAVFGRLYDREEHLLKRSAVAKSSFTVKGE